MKGVAGYGRYDDHPDTVGCPRAHSDMTPCVARDGHLACANAGMCVGCERTPLSLLHQLVKSGDIRPSVCHGQVECIAISPARLNPSTLDNRCPACRQHPADLLQVLVRAATASLVKSA